jgi:hypothetical protein
MDPQQAKAAEELLVSMNDYTPIVRPRRLAPRARARWAAPLVSARTSRRAETSPGAPLAAAG